MLGELLAVSAPSNVDDAATFASQAAEFIGTAAFAASGALVAVRRNLDIVGIILLACATALGGGITRDVLIGSTPPVAFTDLRYIAAAVVTGLVIFVWHPPVRLTRWPLFVTDAIGLGMFAVNGTVIAYSAGLAAPSAALLGLTTAIGGGVIRDVLSGQVPGVLRHDEHLYAIPAFAGAVITAALLYSDVYRGWMGLLCVAFVIGLRLASIRYDWHGPRPRYARDMSSD
ncbi:trimeric intracellular cation channel family protein [Gordonia zhaorongruii]|uniref:trimeric intracellular cation channel family protein n=1 Tax=Gordonia zhaorongruii TaxID=2597659 RepID=UPI001F440A32|nr:trimeric intracellular cation channel family protein [Gordonia zhaorongruii]